MWVGYARTTRDGVIPAAEDASLREAGCELVFADPRQGGAADQQPQLARALENLGPRDVLLVPRLDCLAGGLPELIARIVQVQARGAAIRTPQGAVTSGHAQSKQLLEALLAFDRQRAETRRQRGQAAQDEEDELAARPRLLGDAAERLAASRAHTDAPAPRLARPLRKRRRASTPS
jgi:DNA invertase Pin-like site-specific DNA recombinase